MERIPYVLLVKDRSENSESVLFLFDESGSADEFEKKNFLSVLCIKYPQT